MSDHESNGAAPPELTPEQRAELQQQMFTASVQDTANILKSFFPDRTDAQLLQAAAQAVGEQMSGGMDRILRDAANPTVELPRWGVQLHGLIDHSSAVVEKDPARLANVQVMTGWLATFALALCPPARAAAALLGLRVEFVQARGPSAIKLVDG